MKLVINYKNSPGKTLIGYVILIEFNVEIYKRLFLFEIISVQLV